MAELVWQGKHLIVEKGPGNIWDPAEDSAAVESLLSPKAFSFSVSGRPALHFNRDRFGSLSDNFLFCGDNLPVLASLRGILSNRIRLIYIDPPYNTGLNTFGYPDNLSRELWLTFLKNRLELARELLAEDGSVFLHLDHNASHYGRLLMDEIFGTDRFINEIIWCYHGPGSPRMKRFNRKHDTILWYGKSTEWTFNSDDVRVPSEIHSGGFNGELNKKSGARYMAKGKIPEDWWTFPVAARFRVDGRKRTGYKTEKPPALLERIIRSASHPGDIVLDFFAGSGTTAYAASLLKRRFILVEQRPEAWEIIRSRLEDIPFVEAMLEVREGRYVNWADIKGRPDLDDFYSRCTI